MFSCTEITTAFGKRLNLFHSINRFKLKKDMLELKLNKLRLGLKMIKNKNFWMTSGKYCCIIQSVALNNILTVTMQMESLFSIGHTLGFHCRIS
jgi:hypothetical protein